MLLYSQLKKANTALCASGALWQIHCSAFMYF